MALLARKNLSFNLLNELVETLHCISSGSKGINGMTTLLEVLRGSRRAPGPKLMVVKTGPMAPQSLKPLLDHLQCYRAYLLTECLAVSSLETSVEKMKNGTRFQYCVLKQHM